MTGLDENGFVPKRFDEIRQSLEDEYHAQIDPDLNLSDETFDGQNIGIMSGVIAGLWQLAGIIYSSRDPNNAVGIALSNLVTINGIIRRSAEKSVVTLDLTGTPNALIIAGSAAAKTTGERFITTVDVQLDGAGLGQVIAESENTGPIVAASGTITEIATPVLGWSTVNNPLDATVGRVQESNEDLRIRREASVAFPASNQLDALRAKLLGLEGVRQINIEENLTINIVDDNLPKSFRVVSDGGDAQEIGELIFLNKPPGIPTNGAEVVVVQDASGIDQDVFFDFATDVEMDVEVTLQVTGSVPGDLDDQIKQAIVDYSLGIFEEFDGYDIGRDVFVSRLFTPANSVDADYDVTLIRIAADGGPLGTSNVTIDMRDIARFDTSRITVIQL